MPSNKRLYTFMEDEYVRRFCEKHGDTLKEKLSVSLYQFEKAGYLCLKDIVRNVDFDDPINK
jgi:hypothetical protein